jgi:hypothetical protein
VSYLQPAIYDRFARIVEAEDLYGPPIRTECGRMLPALGIPVESSQVFIVSAPEDDAGMISTERKPILFSTRSSPAFTIKV